MRGHGCDGEKAEGDEGEVHEEENGDGRWEFNGSDILEQPRWVHGGDLQLWESQARSCCFPGKDQASNGSS